MKKSRIILVLSMSMCLLAACGAQTSNAADSPTPAQSQSAQSPDVTDSPMPAHLQSEQTSDAADPSKSAQPQSAAESTQTCVLYAVFGTDNIKEYPVEYSGDKKTAEALADELSKLTGLDFNITAQKTDDGLIVDWAADSTLVGGLDDREQKEEFFFFDNISLNWFMMDSLSRTLTENLGVQNIYYTMDGGKELVLYAMYPIDTFPSDTPYMGQDFYSAHSDVKGDEEDLFARTEGLWRMDGEKGSASIEMNGSGDFTMYYASGVVEAFGYLECVDEYEDGNYRYDCYSMTDELIVSFYFDSDTRLHIGNDDGSVYILDTQANTQEYTEENTQVNTGEYKQPHPKEDYEGFWMYPSGYIIQINGGEWYSYEADGTRNDEPGSVGYEDDGVVLRNKYGSSGGEFLYFNENGYLMDQYEEILTSLGKISPDEIFNLILPADYQGFWIYPDGEILEINGNEWRQYESGKSTPFAWGPVEYDDEAAYLMNEDGSSGGGKVYFDENGNLNSFGTVLTYWGDALSYDNSDDAPKG